MREYVPIDGPYPSAYGIEDEISMRQFPGDQISRTHLDDMILRYRIESKDIVFCDRMDSTGGGMYRDGEHLELTTPEYDTIEDLAARMQSHEATVVDMVAHFMRHFSWVGTIAIHRRVVDDCGNTVGQHDNFGYKNIPELESMAKKMMVGHLSTRSFVSGAGYFHQNGVYFAQKAQHVAAVSGYGYNKNNMFRVSGIEGGSRFETRCNDLNINPFAIRMRVGASAIALAIAQTPLAAPFERAIDHNLGSDLAKGPQRYNVLPIDPDGTFRKHPRLKVAIAFQKHMAETFLSDAMARHAGEQPPQLLDIAKNLVRYCDTMSAVAANDLSYTALNDRSDWAPKTAYILNKMSEKPERYDPFADKTVDRTMNDIRARQHDMAYDVILVTRKDGHIKVTKGYAYELRDKQHIFADEIHPDKVTYVAKHAPSTTRAGLRAHIISTYRTMNANWHDITVHPANGTGKAQFISMPDVRMTQLTADDQHELELLGLRRSHQA